MCFVLFLFFCITKFGVEIGLTIQAEYARVSDPINGFNQPLKSGFDSYYFLYFFNGKFPLSHDDQLDV